MMKSHLAAMTLAGILSTSSLAAFAQTTGDNPPVDKGGMPPSTQMDAGSTTDTSGNALPPGSVSGGNGGDASGSSTSTSPGTGTGSTSGGSSMGGDASSSGTGAGTTDSGGSSGGSSGSSQ